MLFDRKVGHLVRLWSLNRAIGHDRFIGDLWRRAGWRIVESSSIVLWAVFFSRVEVLFP